MAEWYEQPDPLIDDYLALCRRWGLSDIEIRNRELRIKMFEVWMLGKGLSIYETSPRYVRIHLSVLIVHSASVICLRTHWMVLRDYFDFMVWKGHFRKNPVTAKTWPVFGYERVRRDENKIRDPLKGMRGASWRTGPPNSKA